MTLFEEKLRPLHGYEEGRADAVDPATADEALSYKKEFLKRFIPLDQRQIESRLAGQRFYVTRKYDGEYAMIVHDGDTTVTLNRSGRVRRGIPCIEEAGRLLAKAGVERAMIAAEMYVETGRHRGRVNDLLAALADKKRIGTLRLAVFDLVALDGRPWTERSFARTWHKLKELFAGGERVRVVEMEEVTTTAAVRELYDRWVAEEGAEGLVVRSDLPFVYKIKPRHSLDVAVVGYSEGTGAEQGQVRSLLAALMPSEGRYQVVGRVGSGLGEELREALFDRLSRRIIPSQYVATDANFVAFHMVRPDTVIEITVGDLLYETEAGPRMNTVLEIVDDTYRIAATVEGLTFVAPVFVRVRTDKRVDAGDVRLAQIERFSAGAPAPAAPAPTPAPAELPKSRLLFREVYTKTVGAKFMVRKFLVWETRKHYTGDYPAYVLYYADFSTGRREPLQREVKATDDREQALRLLENARNEYVRSGWHMTVPPKRVAAKATTVKAATADTAAAQAPREKPAAKEAADRAPAENKHSGGHKTVPPKRVPAKAAPAAAPHDKTPAAVQKVAEPADKAATAEPAPYKPATADPARAKAQRKRKRVIAIENKSLIFRPQRSDVQKSAEKSQDLHRICIVRSSLMMQRSIRRQPKKARR